MEKAKSENTEFTAAVAAESANLAEAEKTLASLKASWGASKSTSSQVATDHETSVKAFAEELKALVDATKASQGSDVVTSSSEFIEVLEGVTRVRNRIQKEPVWIPSRR